MKKIDFGRIILQTGVVLFLLSLNGFVLHFILTLSGASFPRSLSPMLLCAGAGAGLALIGWLAIFSKRS